MVLKFQKNAGIELSAGKIIRYGVLLAGYICHPVIAIYVVYAEEVETIYPQHHILQEGLLEIAPRAEERQFDLPPLTAFVFESSTLEAAYKIGDLGKPIEAWTGLAICQSLPQKLILECSVQDVRYQTILEKEFDEVTLHFLPKGRTINEFAFPIHKCLVASGDTPNKRCEAERIARPRYKVVTSKAFISMRQGHEMERLVLQSAFEKHAFIANYFLKDIDCLVVKYKSDQIVVGTGSDITGLINEDRKLPHVAIHRLIKMPGDTPRRRDSPPCVERCSIYTTRRFVYSIIPKYEHMFSILSTNIRSTYGKVV